MTLEELQKQYAEKAMELGHKIRLEAEFTKSNLALHHEIELLTEELIAISAQAIAKQNEEKTQAEVKKDE